MIRRAMAAGLVIEAIYLVAVLGPFSLLANGTALTDLGKLTNYQPIAAALVTGGLVALFVAYVVALFNAPAGKRAVSIAIGGTVLFSLTLVFLYPATAIDVYNYAVEGHVAVFQHLNPMVTPPSEVAGDPFVSYAGSWATSPSPYGPIWILLSELDALAAGSNIVLAVFLLKALAGVAVAATTILLAQAFRDHGSRASALAAILFGWNPLVQLELVGNGHNDAVLTLLVIAALVFMGTRKPVLSTMSIGASVLVKFLTLGAIPLFLMARAMEPSRSRPIRFAHAAISAAILISLAIAAYAPFWSGTVTLQRAQAVDTDYLASIPALIILLIPSSINWLTYPRLAVLGIVCLWQANSLRLGQANLAQAMSEVFFATVLVAAHFAGWYLPLLVATVVLSGNRWLRARVVVFTFTTTLTTPLWAYLYWWNQNWMSLTAIHLIVVPLTFVPPLIAALLAMLRPTQPARQSKSDLSTYLDAIYTEIRNAYLTARSVVGSSS